MEPPTCSNCMYFNKKFNLKNESDHYPNDTEKCFFLKNKIKKLISYTDYPYPPKIQRYLGKKVIILDNKKQNSQSNSMNQP